MIKNTEAGKQDLSIARDSLRQKVYRALKQEILERVFVPGRELTVDELSSRYDVSPTPIRDAITRLVAEGFVEAPPNKSARDALISQQDVSQSYLVRRCVESHLATVATRHVQPDSTLSGRVAALTAMCNAFLDATVDHAPTVEDGVVYGEIAAGLRDLMSQSAGECLLTRMLATLADQSRRTRMLPEEDPDNGLAVMRAATEEHRAILVAMANGDAERAAQATFDHLLNAEKRTLESLGKFNAIGGEQAEPEAGDHSAKTRPGQEL